MSRAVQTIAPYPTADVLFEGFEIRIENTSAINPSVETMMASLHPIDRLETLGFAFEEALAAGNQGRRTFNVDAALAALSGDTILLKGNSNQHDAQLKLIEGAEMILRKVCKSLEHPTLQPHERIETLAMAFLAAQRAGTKDHDFDAQRAVQALTAGKLEFLGNRDQIKGKNQLVRLSAVLVERACRYQMPFFDPPKAMSYLRADRMQRIRQATDQESRREEEHEKKLFNAGVEAGRNRLTLTGR